MQPRFLFAAVIAVAGCTDDKATPDYNKCVELEAKGSHDLARAACVSAVSADARSKDGLAAAAKITEIDAKVKEEAARVEGEAAARVAAEAKAQQEADEARCKGKKWATKCMTGHRPDGTEKWTGMQQFDTRAECIKAATGGGTCDECACM